MQDIKIVIVGAGVAGLTCAALLNQHGVQPLIIEREHRKSFNKAGYMLGLLPLGGRVLNSIDAREEYFDNSIEMENYEIYRPDGELIKRYPLDFIHRAYGSYRGITRSGLIDILRGRLRPYSIRFGTTVKRIEQTREGADVTFSDGETARYDLVIAADGLHSRIREMILAPDEFAYYDTGWGGWVTWLETAPLPSYREYWGSGSFTGLYPVKDKTGVFLGGPAEEIRAKGLQDFRAEVLRRIDAGHERLHRALEAFRQDRDPFFWEFHDCRSAVWHKGRVLLLGDAGSGFLPTAGVGASMAMDSAAALADELSRADRRHLDYALQLYTARQKHRVEKAQGDSRQMGKIMFVNFWPAAKIRNAVLPFYSLRRMLSDLTKVMEGEQKI